MKCGHATKFLLNSAPRHESGVGFYENADFGFKVKHFDLSIESYTTPTQASSTSSLGATLHMKEGCKGESGIVTGRFYETMTNLNELEFTAMVVRSVRPVPGT